MMWADLLVYITNYLKNILKTFLEVWNDMTQYMYTKLCFEFTDNQINKYIITNRNVLLIKLNHILSMKSFKIPKYRRQHNRQRKSISWENIERQTKQKLQHRKLNKHEWPREGGESTCSRGISSSYFW
jgi:hypothetical protein